MGKGMSESSPHHPASRSMLAHVATTVRRYERFRVEVEVTAKRGLARGRCCRADGLFQFDGQDARGAGARGYVLRAET
eukprot:6191524-Pleurochrysis_carterae.AAC.1